MVLRGRPRVANGVGFLTQVAKRGLIRKATAGCQINWRRPGLKALICITSEPRGNRPLPASPHHHHPRRHPQQDSAWACSHSPPCPRPDSAPTAEQSLSSRLFPSSDRDQKAQDARHPDARSSILNWVWLPPAETELRTGQSASWSWLAAREAPQVRVWRERSSSLPAACRVSDALADHQMSDVPRPVCSWQRKQPFSLPSPLPVQGDADRPHPSVLNP